MADYVSRRTTEVQELTRVSERISFLYLERCSVSRSGNALTATTEHRSVHVPAAMISCVLLGPGTSITHQGICALADSGTTTVWCGEHAVRYYASGLSLARSTRLLEAQATQVSHRQKRLAVARAMYAMRFPGEDVSRLTMQQLRGREGARVRAAYRLESLRTGVPWSRRQYDPASFSTGDPVNQALSAANSALYGVVQAALAALGVSPGLGFVHTGHQRSFVYDVADLYKAELTIPLAFDIAATVGSDIGGATRRRFRDLQFERKLLPQVCRDVQELLLPREQVNEELTGDVIYLWDEAGASVAGGVGYGDVPW